jgi:thymidylate synthase ThyX
MNISAKVIADSITWQGNRMITMEIEYPRFILAELNTHRMLGKNSASSRAIPINKMHEHIRSNTAAPVYWGRNQAGMQAKEELSDDKICEAVLIWNEAMDSAIDYSGALNKLGVHKQIANRITEPWMTMKTVISGTEWANFFWLRDHEDAQPEFRALAKEMAVAIEQSDPMVLLPGEWHVPYVTTYRGEATGKMHYVDSSSSVLTPEQARIISASCCAQVSYRKNDDSFEKALKIYRQLIESTPAHSSPTEHQATPMEVVNAIHTSISWEPGVTHMTANRNLWSGNLQGWVQFRKLIPNEAKW